jgi:hypothetical protein
LKFLQKGKIIGYRLLLFFKSINFIVGFLNRNHEIRGGIQQQASKILEQIE